MLGGSTVTVLSSQIDLFAGKKTT